MHPSDKICRIWAAGKLFYFLIYYNQPYQLISYLQHNNGEGKDKYIKTCQTGNLKTVGFFLKNVYTCTSAALSFNRSCRAWPLLPEDLNDLLNYLNGLSYFIFLFLNWDTLKRMIFRHLVVIRLCKSTAKLLTCLTLDTCFAAFPDQVRKSGQTFKSSQVGLRGFEPSTNLYLGLPIHLQTSHIHPLEDGERSPICCARVW